MFQMMLILLQMDAMSGALSSHEELEVDPQK